MLALDFALLRRWLPAWWRSAAGNGLARQLAALSARLPQWFAAYTDRKQREALCRADEETESGLTFNRETFS